MRGKEESSASEKRERISQLSCGDDIQIGWCRFTHYIWTQKKSKFWSLFWVNKMAHYNAIIYISWIFQRKTIFQSQLLFFFIGGYIPSANSIF